MNILNYGNIRFHGMHALLPVGPNEYWAMPMNTARLGENVAHSITQAIKIFLEQDTTSDQFNEFKGMGVDLSTEQGLINYIGKFTYHFKEKIAEVD